MRKFVLLLLLFWVVVAVYKRASSFSVLLFVPPHPPYYYWSITEDLVVVVPLDSYHSDAAVAFVLAVGGADILIPHHDIMMDLQDQSPP